MLFHQRVLELQTSRIVGFEIIETEQLALLRDQHCALGHGYLFARPLPVAGAELLSQEMSWVPS